jgi:serine/threonine-protein kinase
MGASPAPVGATEPGPRSSRLDDSRFSPGTLLAGRYRIVARIGRGGMGEVYRADDLKLGQPVALKFLHITFATDPAWLRRFHDEVRIAREIAHPNICRTYDIADADGEHFISMEYVDGEDLATLLRRIGRLPKDKAVQIARQLCAGLAAAHERGVLHRDLKPGNVMLDGRGHVRITDFGIAALADELAHRDVRSGTPAYMAPEQLAGEACTVRSDLYALGLVLYEVYTGREAHHAESLHDLEQMRRSGTPATPSTLIEDMDPLVERVIMRCLEVEPGSRPSSAIAVAAALPGGDPLAMALAAGETPSPEMVAHAGDSGALQPRWALAGLAAALGLCLAAIMAHDATNVRRLLPMDRPPAALLDRIREIEKRLGYTKPHADWDLRVNADPAIMKACKDLGSDDDPFARLKSGRLDVVAFAFRGSPGLMNPRNTSGIIWPDDPPFDVTGMTAMTVDVLGRLLEFKALPLDYVGPPLPPPNPLLETGTPGEPQAPSAETPGESGPPEPAPAWTPLFGAAEIDEARFSPTTPVWIPRVPFDRHAAWTGAFPEHPDIPIRIEAASLRDRLVWFNIYGPWDKPPEENGRERSTPVIEQISDFVFFLLFTVVPVAAGLLAWRNVRAGRGDRRGAWRFALYLTIVGFLGWVFSGHHVVGSHSYEEYSLLSRAVAMAVVTGVTGWLMYLAMEPFARRHWPQSIIAWTRLLSGRWRDPLVGRHILLGAIAGSMVAVFDSWPLLIARWIEAPSYSPLASSWDLPISLRHAVGRLFEMQTAPTFFLGLYVLLLLLRIFLRRQWLAVSATAVLMLYVSVTPSIGGEDGPDWFSAAGSAAVSAMLLFSMVRLGLLAMVVMMLTSFCLWGFPFTTDFSRWYAGIGMIGVLAFAAMAAFGFWVSLAGQPLLKDELRT